MEEIEESIHVEIVDEQIVSETETVWDEDAREFESPTVCECLQSDYQRSGKAGCKIEDKYKTFIMLCSLLSSYEHLVTMYKKDSLNESGGNIGCTYVSLSMKTKCSGSAQGDGLYVKGKQEHGRTQGKGSVGRQRKKSKSRECKKTMECYKCNQKRAFLEGLPRGEENW